jgi:predicted RNA-binding Zn ribbon-like protein
MMTAPRSLPDATADSRAGALPLVGGRLCLDFSNTSSGRGSPTHLDHLVDYQALVAWSRHAEALDQHQAEALFARAERHQRGAEQVLQQALQLREAIHRFCTALADHRRGDDGDLATINAALIEAMPHARVRRDAQGFHWDWESEPALDRMLWPIARSAADLLATDDLGRLKRCNGRDCGWLFLDTSKNGKRRWCEMEVCGSRAKARAYYARKRDAE